jgi:hypothetical protein
LMIAMGFAGAAVLAFWLCAAMLSMKLGIRRPSARRQMVRRPTMAS